MKKIALWGVILTLVFTLTGCSALENMLAEPSSEPTEGLEYELNEDGQSYSVVGIGTVFDAVGAELESILETTDLESLNLEDFIKNNTRDIVIASTYNDLPVTGIGDSAFYFNFYISGVTIPDSVTSIGEDAFSSCMYLKSIHIPAGVTEIATGALATGSLESITADEKNPVYHVDGNCLIKTESKTVIAGCTNSTIPTNGSVTTIGEYAFNGDDFESFSIPAGVTAIEEFAFNYCNSLTSIDIAASVTSIGVCAFAYCSNLTDITFQGTTAEWENIAKANGWDYETSAYTVTCTDGTVAKDGTVTPN